MGIDRARDSPLGQALDQRRAQHTYRSSICRRAIDAEPPRPRGQRPLMLPCIAAARRWPREHCGLLEGVLAARLPSLHLRARIGLARARRTPHAVAPDVRAGAIALDYGNYRAVGHVESRGIVIFALAAASHSRHRVLRRKPAAYPARTQCRGSGGVGKAFFRSAAIFTSRYPRHFACAAPWNMPPAPVRLRFFGFAHYCHADRILLRIPTGNCPLDPS